MSIPDRVILLRVSPDRRPSVCAKMLNLSTLFGKQLQIPGTPSSKRVAIATNIVPSAIRVPIFSQLLDSL